MAISPVLWICIVFILLVGIGTLIQLIVNLVTSDKLQEIKESKSKLFHIISQFLLSFTCIVAGIGIIEGDYNDGRIYGVMLYIISIGMISYSFLNSAGNFYDDKKWLFFVSSLVVVILAIIFCVLFFIYL